MAINDQHALAGFITQESVAVFGLGTDGWAAEEPLLAWDGEQRARWFGSSVALAQAQAVVGAPGDDGQQGDNTGAVYIFMRDRGAWLADQKLSPADLNPYADFGSSVTLLSPNTHLLHEVLDAGGQRAQQTFYDALSRAQGLERGEGGASRFNLSQLEIGYEIAVQRVITENKVTSRDIYDPFGWLIRQVQFGEPHPTIGLLDLGGATQLTDPQRSDGPLCL